MREYIIKRKTENNMDSLPTLSIDSIHWTPLPLDITAGAQICYDDSALYVRLFAKEEKIRTEENGPLGNPCMDSCLEFFFCPNPDDKRYLNFEMNPVCCKFLGMCDGNGMIVRLLPFQDMFNPVVTYTDGGWEITYHIPYSFIRLFFPEFSPKSGGKIRANCYKCGDLTEKPHYISWNEMTSDLPNFHRPCDFGVMIFE